MLTRLELVGFKSFADRTRFEFGRGLTAIVGPNGSGKSNVVDAIRWVFGEQSAKSLRGKEMTDVIFNGSDGRRGLDLAEVTLTVDNARGRFALPQAEVQITRRVYRDGGGEYLINGQVTRLRDLRALLRGTGAATAAYSIIEQGKVDSLLQASTRDRRAVFEEAAGISRFRAQKAEAARNLERAEANLLRLGDLIEEVERQHRSLKLQAARARRYQEYAAALRQHRVQLAADEVRALAAQWRAEQHQVKRLTEDVSAAGSEVRVAERRAADLETTEAERQAAVHQVEAELADGRAAIAGLESAMAAGRSRAGELERQEARAGAELIAQVRRRAELRRTAELTDCQVRAVEAGCAARRAAIDRDQAELDLRRAALAEGQARRAAAGEEQVRQLRVQAELQALGAACRSRRDALVEQQAVLERQAAAVDDRSRRLEAAEAEARSEESRRAEHLAALSGQLAALRSDQAGRAAEADRLAQALARARETRVGLVSRRDVLHDLERRQEGVQADVRAILRAAEEQPEGPWAGVIGPVADLLRVDARWAAVVEAALGERSQYLVVRRAADLVATLGAAPTRPQGRVGFIALDGLGPGWRLEDVRPEAANGPLVPLVACLLPLPSSLQPQASNLASSLLGRTVVVPDLEAAMRARPELPPGWRMVTEQGEVVEPDGVVTVGSRLQSGGILSRRGELQVLDQAIERSDTELAAAEGRLHGLIDRGRDLTRTLEQLQARQAVEDEALAQLRGRIDQAAQERGRLAAEAAACTARRDASRAAVNDTAAQWARIEAELETVAGRLAELHDQLEAARTEIGAAEIAARCGGDDLTARRVELARSEQHLLDLRDHCRALERDLAEGDQRCAELEGRLDGVRRQRREADRELLQAESAQALRYHVLEGLADRAAAAARDLRAARDRRHAAGDELQRIRSVQHDREAALHAADLRANDCRLRCLAIVERIREEYAVDLGPLIERTDGAVGPLDGDPSALSPLSAAERERAAAAVDDLRRRIAQLGAVNLDAIRELEELDARLADLHRQHEDLSQARAAIHAIIRALDADSRRLFIEAFEAIRGHFRELFRKLFGGGGADILFETPDDPLESGIEIIARPPGKEPRRLSLLSGGEKTLTAVALLLAVFRSRPGPFCLLDEVDAALDEANIDRFLGVLEEFLAETQFILVTHSKKTMTAAQVLYGVTMQDQGVSTRVVVRLEDVRADGRFDTSDDAA